MVVIDKLTLLKNNETLYQQWNMMFHVYTDKFFSEKQNDLEYVIIDGDDFYASDGKVANVLGNCMLGYGFSMCPFYPFQEMKEIVKVKSSLINPSTNTAFLLYGIYAVSMKLGMNDISYVGSLNEVMLELITLPTNFELYAYTDGICARVNGTDLSLEEFALIR